LVVERWRGQTQRRSTWLELRSAKVSESADKAG
jgi:hypothetical protein